MNCGILLVYSNKKANTIADKTPIGAPNLFGAYLTAI